MRSPAAAAAETAKAALLLAGLLLAQPALAHEQAGQAAGWLAGLLHPASGLDHVLAMLAVGLWGAQLGAPAIWLLPVTFPLVMAFGGFLALVGVPLPGVELGIAASALLLGGLVAAQSRPPLWLAAAVVGLSALFHGHAHGTELPAGHSGLAYSAGFVMATGGLHAAGVAIGLVHRWHWGQAALRAAGAAIGAAGVHFLWRAL